VRRGILGGTFDPPHIAHLVAGEVAYRDVGLDVVTFLPAGRPWQKEGSGVTDAEHRRAMTGLAVEDVDYFELDDREVLRDGWTYTADTLDTFAETDHLVLILGGDAASRIRTWHRWEYVLERTEIAVMPRSGASPLEVASAVGPHHVLDSPVLDVSGTELRARCRRRASIRFLVPEPVRTYIEENRLYA
jgi:nicotinate-nucleotide adenylyltransferase